MKLTQEAVAKIVGKFKINNEIVNLKQSISWFANNLSKKIYLTQDNTRETIESYNIDKNLKRYCLIFDNYDFDQNNLIDKYGSHEEANIYYETFRSLNFETKVYPENKTKFSLTSKMINSILNEAKSKPCSMFVAIFLSNGSEKSIACSDGSLLISDIISSISNKDCENLIGIPKLVIFSPIYEGKNKIFI
jgi:hypothetical protein